MACTSDSTHTYENPMFKIVTDVTRQMRLAGLGAIVKAQQLGSELLESLIEEGEKVESQGGPSRLLKASPKPKRVLEPAQDDLENLENMFQDRVARSLEKLSIPTHEDLRKLHAQVESLSNSVEVLAEQETDQDLS